MNAQRLAETYMLASTPNALYRRLRDDKIVQDLAARYSAADLHLSYTAEASQRNKAVEDAALAYAYLVALTLRDDAKLILAKLDPYGLDWAQAIVDMATRPARPPAPLVSFYRVLPPGTTVREGAGRNQPILEALTPGIMFQGLRRGAWVWRLGGGYVEAVSVEEVT